MVGKKKPNPFIEPTAMGTFSLYELQRFFSLKERRKYIASRAIGNYRLRKNGRPVDRVIDWRK